MVPQTTTMADENSALTPGDVREQFTAIVEYQAEHGHDKSPFQELLTPRARVAIVDALLGVTEPLTVSEICERGGLTPRTFHDHREFLQTAGVLESAGMKGNAETWTLEERHPVVQALTMLDVVLRHGVTPQLLEEQFIGDPGEQD